MEPPSSNPLLAAEARKESVLPRSIITPTPPTNVSRNPFKKSTTPRYEKFRKKACSYFDGFSGPSSVYIVHLGAAL